MRKPPRSRRPKNSVWKSPVFIKRLSSWLVLSTAITLAVSYGAQLQWDPDANANNNNVPTTGSGLGGTGTWDTTAQRWWTGSGPDVAWNATPPPFNTAVFGGLVGGTVTVGAPVTAGGLKFNTGGYVVTPSSSNTLTLDTAVGAVPLIEANASATIGQAGEAGIVGSKGLIKSGGGTLTVIGDNTDFTGTIILKSGALALSGGNDGSGTATKSLGNAQAIVLEGGVLRFLNDGGISIYGNAITLNGNATIFADNATTGANNVVELGDLTIRSNTLTTTNGNTYGISFKGMTTLTSAISTINSNMTPPVGAIAAHGATTLAGQITGPGALNKTGTGTLFIYNASFSPDNDYAGGTNVLGGVLAIADSFSQLGSGNAIVHPGTALRLQDNQNLISMETGGGKLYLQSSSSSMSVLGLEADFSPGNGGLGGDTVLNNALISPYGAVVQINSVTTTFANVFDFTKFGPGSGGKIFLGASQDIVLNGFDDQLVAASDNIYRLGASTSATTTLTLSIENLINGGAGKSLVIGVPANNIQAITNGTGTVAINKSQNYDGLTTINSGSTLSTGGFGTTDLPRLGTGSTINIFGTLTLAGRDNVQLNQTTFNVLQARGTNGAMILTVTDPDFAGIGSTNDRLKPTSVLNFFGGTLTFNGYSSGNAGVTPIISQQAIAQFNASAANTISLTTGTAVGENLDTVLTLTNLNRVNSGTVAFSRTGQVYMGNTSSLNDVRVIIPNLKVNGVGTGTPTVTNGMIAPWLIDTTSYSLPGDGTTVANSTQVTASSVAGLVPGMIVTGNGIPLGATVTSVTPEVTLTNTAGTINGNTTVTMTNTTGLVAGMIVSGSNIPANSRIVSITPNTSIVISNAATGNGVGGNITASGLYTISNAATATNQGLTIAATANQFLTYGASGLAPTSFDVYATSAALLQAATTAQKVAVTTSFNTSANASVQALRIGDVAVGGTNTITIGSSSANGAGLILSQANNRTHTPNFVFGTAGASEAVIYVTGGAIATLSGSISATGLTKFGANTLVLTGTNTSLQGNITINQGAIDGNPAGYNYRPVILNAGTLNYDTGGSANVGTPVTVNGDSTLTAGDVEVPRIASLTINARATTPDAIVFTVAQGLSVTGTTTLNGTAGVAWNHTRADRNSDLRATAFLGGQVTGTGVFNKWGAGQTSFLSGTNNYSGGTTINAGTLTSQVGGAGTPFGSGSITVNPGGVLRLANSTNIGTNTVSVNSDMNGIGVISMIYNGKVALNGALPTITFNKSTFGGPFSAVLAVDSVGYSGNINLNTFGGGTAFFGSVLGGNFTGSLTPSTQGLTKSAPSLNGVAPVDQTVGVYRLGGGGNSNVQAGLAALNFVGAPNQLTGANGVQIGIINNVTAGASLPLSGGFGTVALYNTNDYSGNTYLNTGGNLLVGRSGALGASKIVFNGGGIQADTGTGLPFVLPRRIVSNNVGFTGDAIFNGATDLDLSANFGLADNQVGVTRTFTVNNTTGLTTLSGVISDGAGTSSLSSITKAGGGPLVLTGANTYTGFTNINAGTLVVSSDTNIHLGSQITFGGAGGSGVTGSLGVWTNSFTTDRNYIIQNGANATFDIGIGQTLTQSSLSNISGIGADTAILKNGLGTLVLNAHNSFSATGSWAIRILNGNVEVNSDVNLGDPVANKGIVVQGGSLRVTDSFTSGRQIINGAASGGVDVAAGKVFTSTGQLNSNGGTNVLTKTGAGTLRNDFNNVNLDRLTVQGGAYSSTGMMPITKAVSFTATGGQGVNTLTGIGTSINNLYVGLLVSGPGIASGTRISSIDYLNGSVTLSTNPGQQAVGIPLSTGTGGILTLNGGSFELLEPTGPIVLSGTSTEDFNNATVTVASTGGLRIGQSITGTNIAPGTTIRAIRDGNTFLLSQNPLGANTSPTQFTIGAVPAGNSTGIDTVTFGGGGRLKIQSSNNLSSQLSVTNLNRTAAGTLIIDPGTSALGVAGNGAVNGNVRVIPVSTINDIAVGSANVNGILSPNIIVQSGNVGSFATYTGATTGIASYSGATVGTLAGLQPTSIFNGAGAAVNGTSNSIYAVRTTGNITGSGNLNVVSINNTNREGGILLNGNISISSNLTFSPSDTTGTVGLTNVGTTVNSNTLIASSVSGVLPGMAIVGPNIPSGTVVTSTAAAVNLTGATTTNTLTTVAVADVTGLVAGMGVTGTNIPANSKVVSVAPGVGLSGGSTGNGNNTVVVASTSGLVRGMIVSGPNIPAGARITNVVNQIQFQISAPATGAGSGLSFTTTGVFAIDNAATADGTGVAISSTALVTINNSATATATGLNAAANLGVVGTTTATLATISGTGNGVTSAGNVTMTAGSRAVAVTSTAGVTAGMSIIAPNIPNGTLVSAVSGAVTLTGGTTVNGSATVTVSSTTGLLVGMLVSGSNIPSGARVTSVGTGTFDINVPATGNGSSLTITSTPLLTLTNPATADASNQTAAVADYDATGGEGIIYAAPSTTSSITGKIWANGLVKSGVGDLTLSGVGTGIIGNLTIQNGTLRLGSGLSFDKNQTGLVLNNSGSLDLAGQRLTFASITNSSGMSGGTVSSSAGNGVLVISGGSSSSTSFGGNIVDGAGTTALVKSGTNTLTLGGFSVNNPDAGNNTYSGGTTLNQGAITLVDPRGLGTGLVTLQGAGTLNLRSNGPGINSTIIVGPQTGSGLNLVVNGLATIDVNNNGANTGNVFTFNNLALNEGQLSTAGGNNYRLRIAGTTTLAGGFGTINSIGADFAGGSLDLAGVITGAGTLNKLGSNYFKLLTISGNANTYTGGTTIQSGMLQVTATTGTPLGTGSVTIYPGAALRIAGNNGAAGTIGGAALRTLARWNSFGIVGLDDDNFNPATTLNSTSFANSYGAILTITRPFYAGTLDQSAIGDGRSFLAGGLNAEVGFLGTLAPGLGDGVASRVYRLAGGNNLNGAGNLAIIGVDNTLADPLTSVNVLTSSTGNSGVTLVSPAPNLRAGDILLGQKVLTVVGVNVTLAGNANQTIGTSTAVNYASQTSLQVGAQSSIVNNGIIQNLGNTLIIRESNSFTGGTWIGKGSNLQIEVGGSPAGSTPLGSANGALNGAAANVEVFGTLQNAGFGSSFVNALTGKNSVNVTLRPGGVVTLNDIAGSPAGNQGRWADTDANGGGINLNGGTFQYSGASSIVSTETIGTLGVTGGGRVIINRQADANDTTLTVAAISRTAPSAGGIGGGTLTIEPRQGGNATGGIIGIPNLPSVGAQQESGSVGLLVGTAGAATTLGGTTANGTGVTAPGMAPAWIIDTQQNSFVGYSTTGAGTGYQPLLPAGTALNPGQIAYSKNANGTLTAAQFVATDIVEMTTNAKTLADNPTIYALRTSQQINPTASNNLLTITSGGLILNGAFTINSTVTTNAPLAMTLQFGAGGTGEALIYGTGNDVTINATLKASALTRFAPQGNGNTLTLTANNQLTGPVTINAGRILTQNTLSNTGTTATGVFSGQNVILAGAGNRDASRLSLTSAVGNAIGSQQASGSGNVTSLLGGTVYVNGESRLDVNATAFTQRITNLTFADRGVRSPVSLTIQGVYVQGTTTLGANDNSVDAFFDNFGATTFGGLVQGGTLSKFNNGSLLFAGTANTFAGLNVNGSGLATATSIVGSLTQTGSPFGSGAITVNPGGLLRIMNGSNIATNSSIKINTDGAGLGGLGISSNLTQAQIAALFGTGAGKVQFISTTNLAGQVSLDTNSFNSALDIAALETAIGGGKKILLGTSTNGFQSYFNSTSVNYNAATLGSSADNIYRLGGGGNQGSLAFGVGTFENVFGAGKDIILGAATAANGATANHLVNGNGGTYTLNTRNTTFNGTVTVNPNMLLSLENAYALGTGSIVLNQNNASGAGGIRIVNSQTVGNAISVMGDVLNVFGNGDNGTFTGNVNLSPTGVGGTKTFGGNYGNVSNSLNVAFTGVISGAGVNVIKSGGNNNNGGSYIFRGVNTYTGTTTINSGTLFAGTDVLPNTNGAFGNSDTPIVLGNVGSNSGGAIGIAGQFIFGRSIISTGASGTGSGSLNFLRGQTLGETRVTGGIAITGGTLIVDSRSSADAVGGVIDLQGAITGTGALQIGDTSDTATQANGTRGIIRLSANANGLGTSTFSGGSTFRVGRLQIAADTSYTGTAKNPTILSGPLGTGSLTLGAAGFGDTGTIEAYGADRVVVNTLGAYAWNNNSTTTYAGHYNLTFTREWNFQSDPTLRSRTLAITATQGVVGFAGNLYNSSIQGSNLIKTGVGTLVLGGLNTQQNLLTTDGNYGTTLFIDAGVASVSQDANLGLATVAVANGTGGAPHTAGSNSDIRLRGGVLQVTSSFSSNRNLIFANSGTTAAALTTGIDVSAGQTFTVTSPMVNTTTIGTTAVAPTGVTLTKTGAGILALNSASNSFANLVIGGQPLATAANLTAGISGGTVSTTAVNGTPFATTLVTINGGAISLVGGAANQALTIPTVTFAGGSYIQLNPGATSTVLTATALTRTGQGTLTLLPSVLAGLGATAAPVVGTQNLITSSSFTNTSGMLTSPVIYARLAGVGADADFVQYGGANGFSLRASNGGNDGASINATAATGNALIAASATPDTTQSGAKTVNAVRTAANLASPTQTLTITTGGLILNRNTANGNAGVNISTNLVFGAPGEALVYVTDGTTSTPTLSGNFTATNFTKSGPGNLLLSGTANVMAPTSGGLRILTINEGALSVAGQSSLPSGGLINVATSDAGIFDLAGQSLTIGGLSGTGAITNTGAARTLTALVNNQTTTFNGLISGGANLALVSQGTGTLVLGTPNSYSGGTTINASLITSASGLFTPQGTLSARGINSLGTGAVTLAGGNLEFNNAFAANEVFTNFNALLQGAGSGYNLTVNALNNLGTANTTSTITTTNTTAFQAINNLTVNAPVLSFAGASANGLLVSGTTTFNQATTLNLGATQTAVLAGPVAAAGQALTKIGGATLFLTGTGNGTIGGAANSVGSWTILAGAVEARLSDGGTNPLGTNAVTLNGGTLNIRHDGDGLADAQTLTTFGSTNLSIGSALAASSASYVTSANATLNVDRITATGTTVTNKTVQIGSVSFGGALGSSFLTFSSAGGGNFAVEITGGVSLTNNAYFTLSNNPLTISGGLSGNGTFFKNGGGEFDLNTVATNSGGTMLFQGTTNFGSFIGNTRTLSTTAKFAAGDITVNNGTTLRFNSTGNINGTQRVDARSKTDFYAVIGIGSNEAVSAFNLRAPLAGGAFDGSLVAATSTGAGVLAINNSAYTQSLDLNTLGDGTWYLGTTNNGAGVTSQSSVNGVYAGVAALGSSRVGYNFGVGSSFNGNGIYRLGGGGAGNILSIGLPGGTANTLTNATGTYARNVSLVVGGAATGVAANGVSVPTAIGGTTGIVILNTAQNYSGTTLVNIGSTLEFRGTMSTAGYDNFGTLAAGGSGGTFAGVAAANIVSRPGSFLRLDNSFDLPAAGLTEGRWGDTTALNLNSSTLRVIGNTAADIREVVGAVSVSGQSFLVPQRSITGRSMEINVASLARTAGATLSIEPANAGQLGTDERVTVAGANLTAQLANIAGVGSTVAAGVTNGMVAPWLYNRSDMQFLTYSDFGFANAGFDILSNVAAPTALTTGTNRALFNGQTTVTIGTGITLDVWALRLDSNGTNATTYAPTTSGTEKFIIRSGGLLANGTGQANVTVTAGLQFGVTGTPTEALIGINANTLIIGSTATPTTAGQIVASSISKSGDGTLEIASEQSGFTGSIYLNRGSLTLRTLTAGGGSTTNVGGAGGTIFFNGPTTTLNLRTDAAGVAGTGTTFNNNLSIGAGVLMAVVNVDRTTASATNAVITVNNLTFGGSPGDQGQTLTVSGGNSYGLRINGTTALAAGFNYFNLVSNGTNLTLAGAITGSGNIVAEGNNGTLFLGASGVVPTAGWTGGGSLIVTSSRTVQANAAPTTTGADSSINTALSYLGTGPITLAGGTLNLRVDSGIDTTFRTYTFNAGNAVTVTGNSTITADRITGTGTNKLFALPTLNIGGQTLTSTSTNTHSIQFNAVNLSGTPTFSVGNDFVVQSVKDNGAGLYVVKTGGGTLWYNDNTSTNTGGVYVNQGALRFGNPGAASATATAGAGSIQINPQGAIRVEGAANLSANQLTTIGTSWSLPIERLGTALTQTQIAAYTNSASTNTQLRLEAANSNALNLAALGDGTFFLGSQGNVTYSGNTLGAGTQVTLGQVGFVAGATGGTYRLGSNDAAGSVFTLAPATASNTILTGTSNVVIGTQAIGGNNGTGTVLFNQTNNYTLGTTISRGSEGRIQTGTANTPLGSGQVDVFGTLRSIGTAGTFVGGGATNTNAIVMHPGSTVALDGNTATAGNNTNRWGTDAVGLNGSAFSLTSQTATGIAESVGAITYANGSRILLDNAGTGTAALTLTTTAGLTRTGTGTLVFVPTDAFGSNAVNTANFVTTSALPAVVSGSVNMLPAYIVNGFANAVGQSFVTDGGSNRLINVTYTDTNFASPGATRIEDVTATTTLNGDASVQAVRLGGTGVAAVSLNNALGQLNTVTINATAANGGILSTNNTGTSQINPNLNFSNQEAIIFQQSGGTLQLNGDISGVSSAGITKFGAGTLAIGKDQTIAARGAGNGYVNGWTVNEGQLTPLTFGALGEATVTNVVRLSASTAPGANAIAPNSAVLRLTVNAGNSSLNYYTIGDLQVLDSGTISYDPGANDRMSALGAAGSLSNIVVTSTGGTLQDAQFAFDTNRDRSEVVAGNLQISGTNAGLQLRVNNSNQTSGTQSGLSVAGLVGASDTRLTKIGNGELFIRGSSTYSGTVSIEQGAIGVFANSSLGSGATTVRRYGVLDVQTANYSPTGTVTYQIGGIERWSVDGARSGTLNLGNGTLQVNNDQTANTVAVTLNGGSIEAFLRNDDNLGVGQGQAVYRTLNSNITFNLTGNSFLGQNINQGLAGFDNGRAPTVFSPTTNSLTGASLEIKGVISSSGTFGVTKQGYDTVTLSGLNSYTGTTFVQQGLLRIGAANSLPSGTELRTTGGGVFDLNGYNQTVGRLTSPSDGLTAGTTNAAGSGYITNTAAATTNTLVISGSVNGVYGGVIQYNVAVTKSGANVQTLTNTNTYVGPTTVTGGVLEISGSLTGTSKVDINTGGTLSGAATVGNPLTTALAAGPVNLNGGTFSPGTAGATSGVNSVGTFNAAGGFTTGGGGILAIDLQTRTLAGTANGPSVNDKINVTGAISLTGTTTIQLTLTGGYTPAQGDLFFIALNDGVDPIAGTPANFSVANTGGVFWQVFTDANSISGNTSGGNDIAILAIPEPNALTMLAGSIGMALGLRRFRRRRREA